MKIAPKALAVRDLMDEMIEGVDQGFHRLIAYPIGSFWPAVDIRETDKTVTVEMEAPNIDPENVSIFIEGMYARIEGSKEEKRGEKGENYTRREIYRGNFSRVVPLPCAVDQKPIDAEYEKGSLRFVFQKLPPTPKEKVKVKVK